LNIRGKKTALMFFAVASFSVNVFANKDTGIHIIPMASYNYINFDDQAVHIRASILFRLGRDGGMKLSEIRKFHLLRE
jgi:hypothetical protein